MASAAILAGGRARRFDGRDKSLLTVGGRPILHHQLEVLSAISSDILLIGASRDGAQPARQRALAAIGPDRVRTVRDRIEGQGPLGALETALAAAREEPLVLLACDMPFVTADWLAFLLTQSEGVDAVVPKTGRGYHPLCAVYSRRAGQLAARMLEEGHLKMTDLLMQMRVREIGPDIIERFGPPARLLANINTPAEFGGLEALSGHKL